MSPRPFPDIPAAAGAAQGGRNLESTPNACLPAWEGKGKPFCGSPQKVPHLLPPCKHLHSIIAEASFPQSSFVSFFFYGITSNFTESCSSSTKSFSPQPFANLIPPNILYFLQTRMLSTSPQSPTSESILDSCLIKY